MSFLLPTSYRFFSTSTAHRAWITEHYARNTVKGSRLGNGTSDEVESFIQVRELLLDREIKQGVISSGDQNTIEDFSITYGAKVATYTNPRNGERAVIDLTEIEDASIQDAINDYYKKSGGEKWLRGKSLIALNKGNQSGAATLKRDTNELNALPNNLEDGFERKLPFALTKYPNQSNRIVISRRFLFVEYFLRKWTERLREKIETKKREAKDRPLDSSDLVRLRKEIRQLETLTKELKSIDMYALSMVLTHYPLGKRPTEQMLDEIAVVLKDRIRSDIGKKSWIGNKLEPGIVKKLREQSEQEYIKDVMGMLYADRESYFSFCNRYAFPKKREGAVDVILREAVTFAITQGADYTAEGFKKSSLLHGFSSSLKDEVSSDLHACGVLATHAIGPALTDEYTGEMTYPQGSTETDKKKIDADRLKHMEESVAKHRGRVNRDLTIDQVPAPAEPEVGAGSLVRTGVASAAAVGTGVAAAMYAGLVDPNTAWRLANYIQMHPGRPIALVSVMDSMRQRFMGFVAPQERVEDGSVHRRINYRRLAAVGSMAAFAALAGMSMYNATHDDHEDDSYMEQAGEYVGALAATAANSVDYVWNNSWLSISRGRAVPLIGYQWEGNIPMMSALGLAGGVARRMPRVVQAVTTPAHRALSNVAIGSSLIPLVGSIGSRVAGAAQSAGSWAWNQMPSFSWGSTALVPYSTDASALVASSLPRSPYLQLPQ